MRRIGVIVEGVVETKESNVDGTTQQAHQGEPKVELGSSMEIIKSEEEQEHSSTHSAHSLPLSAFSRLSFKGVNSSTTPTRWSRRWSSTFFPQQVQVT
jgi:hypothetical protein